MSELRLKICHSLREEVNELKYYLYWIINYIRTKRWRLEYYSFVPILRTCVGKIISLCVTITFAQIRRSVFGNFFLIFDLKVVILAWTTKNVLGGQKSLIRNGINKLPERWKVIASDGQGFFK